MVIKNIFNNKLYIWKKLIELIIKCTKYRKFKNPKVSYFFNETLVFPIICRKSGSNNDTIFKKEEFIEKLKILDLINNISE